MHYVVILLLLLLLRGNLCGNVSIYFTWFHLSRQNRCFHHVGPVQNPGAVVESWRSSSCNLTHLLIDEGMGMLITVIIVDLAMWLPVVCRDGVLVFYMIFMY